MRGRVSWQYGFAGLFPADRIPRIYKIHVVSAVTSLLVPVLPQVLRTGPAGVPNRHIKPTGETHVPIIIELVRVWIARTSSSTSPSLLLLRGTVPLWCPLLWRGRGDWGGTMSLWCPLLGRVVAGGPVVAPPSSASSASASSARGLILWLVWRLVGGDASCLRWWRGREARRRLIGGDGRVRSLCWRRRCCWSHHVGDRWLCGGGQGLCGSAPPCGHGVVGRGWSPLLHPLLE